MGTTGIHSQVDRLVWVPPVEATARGQIARVIAHALLKAGPSNPQGASDRPDIGTRSSEPPETRSTAIGEMREGTAVALRRWRTGVQEGLSTRKGQKHLDRALGRAATVSRGDIYRRIDLHTASRLGIVKNPAKAVCSAELSLAITALINVPADVATDRKATDIEKRLLIRPGTSPYDASVHLNNFIRNGRNAKERGTNDSAKPDYLDTAEEIVKIAPRESINVAVWNVLLTGFAKERKYQRLFKAFNDVSPGSTMRTFPIYKHLAPITDEETWYSPI